MADRGMRAVQAAKAGAKAGDSSTSSKGPATTSGPGTKVAAPKASPSAKPAAKVTAAVTGSKAAAGTKATPTTAVVKKPAATAASGKPAALAGSLGALTEDILLNKFQAVQERLIKEPQLVDELYVDPDPKGMSNTYKPLHAAVRAGSITMVEALLKAGADASALDGACNTPLHWLAASSSMHQDSATMAEILLQASPAAITVANHAKLTPLHLAAQHGAADVVTALCKAQGVDVEASAPGHRPLHSAAKAGSMACIDALLTAGAKLGAVDGQGYTPLMVLVQGGFVREAVSLLQRGDCAVSTVAAADGQTALSLACSHPVPDMALVEALLQLGASPDIQDPTNGYTVVMSAIAKKQVPLARALLRACKDVKQTSPKGENAMSLAKASGEEALVAAVLAALGPDAAGPEAVQLMKVVLAAKRDDIAADLVGLLKPAQLSALDVADARSLLALGLPATAVAYVQRFHSGKGVDAAVDEDGSTLLHAAAAMEGMTYEVFSTLLKLGLSIHAVTKAENATPLHVAAKTGNVAVSRALMDGGADPTKRNSKNRTPGNQPKIPECTREYLVSVEDDYKKRKEEQKADMFGSKIQATQTESAFGVRVM